MAVDQALVDAAIDLAHTRFADQPWSGAAALRLDNGAILTSTGPDAPNAAASLCHETGALCEAFKLNRKVVASVSVTAAENSGDYWILAPCGICQERLFAYGPDVEVGVPEPTDPRRWHTLRLRDVQPHWFARVFPGQQWPTDDRDRPARRA
ncbi:MAG TPA: cytidine deaminase [Pseudonocardiaceae bacterium]|jgi:cytidine deaminase|nr:cytidine deaminase [Pseudonocardiaceae bacterium]